MGRPRKFDFEQAVRTASDLFWRKGYDGTSVQDLTAAMGITPPSFYFAFVSKEALFLRVVDAYQQDLAAIVADAFSRPGAREGIAGLLDGFSDLFTDPVRAPGCLILNNALPLIDSHPFRTRFAEERDAFRIALCQRLERAKAEEAGFPASINPDAFARLIVAVLWGLAVEAQSGAGRDDLRRASAALLALWPS